MTEYININIEKDDFGLKLGGGIPKGVVGIIEGSEGFGKSIISQRILYGALYNGHSVTYISTELSVVDFIRQMNSLGYHIEDYLLSGSLLFIPTLTLFGKIKEGEDLIFELKKEKSRKIFEKDIIIIDSLSYPLINGIDRKKAIEIIDFLYKIKNMDKTILITYNPKEINKFFLENIRRVSDIYLMIKISTLGESMIRYIEVKRFRYPQSLYSTVIPFRVEPGIGLIVEVSSLV